MAERFKELHSDGLARVGEFTTKSGVFATPNFMPVGTQGSVKGIDVHRLREVGAQILLVNTYHLSLRPGAAIVRTLGDIHTFSGWRGPILSDSGGFQVFSLEGIRKISEEGVEFRSHLDGSVQFLSPERSIQIQEELGVDIATVFDECPGHDKDLAYIEESLARTVRWAARSLAARQSADMAIFGITQGCTNQALRTRAAAEISALPLEGMAIGGLSVGEPIPLMYEVLSYHVQQLPRQKIHYLMGVGTPADIVEGVRFGVDLFDCVIPTRSGRFGRAFVRSEPEPYLNLRNVRFVKDDRPLDGSCDCLTCRTYSRGYLHHLFKAKEMLAPQLLSLHNLHHYFDLMKEIRLAITEQRFTQLYQSIKMKWSNVINKDL